MECKAMGQIKSEPAYMTRINFLKERVLNTRPEMDLENARILTESFLETGGLPWHVRKAKAVKKTVRRKDCKNMG